MTNRITIHWESLPEAGRDSAIIKVIKQATGLCFTAAIMQLGITITGSDSETVITWPQATTTHHNANI